jgi:hypothetical protein
MIHCCDLQSERGMQAMPVLPALEQYVSVWNISPGHWVAVPPEMQGEQVPFTVPALVTTVTGTAQGTGAGLGLDDGVGLGLGDGEGLGLGDG